MGFFDFLSGFLGGAADLGATLSAFISWVINAMLTLFTLVVNVLLQIANFLFGIVKAIGNFLQTLWDKFFKGIFSRVWQALVKAHQWLEDHLRPLIRFLQRVQVWFDRIYARYIRPFLNLIQHIRQFLLILKLLHVKFAIELDAKLAQIQTEVARVFIEARAILNNVVNVVNLIADPTALLRKPVLIVSARRSVGALIRVLTGMPPGYYFPSPLKNAAAGWGPVSFNFNPLDPAQNPPASAYLGGDDGLGSFGFFATDQPMPDSAVDDLELLDFFNDDLWPESACKSPVECLRAIRAAQLENILND